MTLLTINGVMMPDPVQYKVDYGDIESDSGGESESESGKIVRDVVRSNKCTIDAAFKVEGNELKKITDATAYPAFEVRYFDPVTCAMKTAQMYQKGKQSTLLSLSVDSGFWDFSFTLYEF